jgi:hypothetical protein
MNLREVFFVTGIGFCGDLGKGEGVIPEEFLGFIAGPQFS